MIRAIILSAAVVPLTLAAQEPAPRRLTPTVIRMPTDVATVSGVYELRDGRILVSDAKHVAVLLVDPTSGAATHLSSAGGDSIQYAQPGGFYAGMADTVLLLDRALARFLVISPSGVIITSRSIKQRGVSSSSDQDVDFQRIDARGLAYFTEQPRGGRVAAGMQVTDSVLLLRFDAARQRRDTVARLRQRERRVTQVGDNMTTSQVVFGSPEDEWGVAPDGRIVIVRASPYRVEWHGADGVVVRGSEIHVDPIAYTAEEMDSLSSAASAREPSVGVQGAATTSAANHGKLFATVKPPFDPHDVIVSPDGRVWVSRTRAAGASAAVYDVFDGAGHRVDRIELPTHSRVIGFGRNAIYAVEHDVRGLVSLRKYKVS